MKRFALLTNVKSGMIGMMCLIAALATSCSKDHDDDDFEVPPTAALSIINASPSTQGVDLFVDQSRVNSAAMMFGSRTPYLQAYAGKRTVTFYASGTQQKIKSDTLTLVKDRAYSLYLTNLPTQAEFVVFTDSLARPAAGKATVRFVHVSHNTPAVDLVIKDGATIAAGRTYKTATAFLPVDGDKTYTLEVRQAGTNNVLTSISNVSLITGGVYTVWLQGLASATDQTKLSVNVQGNRQYN